MQGDILTFLRKTGKKHSISELCDRLGINIQTCHKSIEKLLKQCVIDYCLVDLPDKRRTYRVFWATTNRVEKILNIYRPKVRPPKNFVPDINEFSNIEINLLKFMTRVSQLREQIDILEKNSIIIQEMKENIIKREDWKTFPAKKRVLNDLRIIERKMK